MNLRQLTIKPEYSKILFLQCIYFGWGPQLQILSRSLTSEIQYFPYQCLPQSIPSNGLVSITLILTPFPFSRTCSIVSSPSPRRRRQEVFFLSGVTASSGPAQLPFWLGWLPSGVTGGTVIPKLIPGGNFKQGLVVPQEYLSNTSVTAVLPLCSVYRKSQNSNFVQEWSEEGLHFIQQGLLSTFLLQFS